MPSRGIGWTEKSPSTNQSTPSGERKLRLIRERDVDVENANGELCIYCCNQPADTIFACGEDSHMFACKTCATGVAHDTKVCPVCRKTGKWIMRVFVCGISE